MGSRLRKRPSLDRVAQVLTGPLGALVLALALALLCGTFVERRGLALAGGLAALIVLGLGYPWLAVRLVSGTVRFENTRLREGEALRVRWELRNHAWVPLWGLQVQGIVAEDEPEALRVMLRARGRRHALELRMGLGRGCYPLAPPRVRCVFPFGLGTAGRALPCTQEVLVWPAFFPAPELPPGGDAEAFEGTIPARKAGTSGDLIGVRDFRRGDSLRRIHWPQTARHDRLIVTERQALRLPLVLLTLDLTGAAAGPDSEREWAIRAAMSLIEGWSSQGVRLEVLVHDEEVTLLTGGLRGLRDGLARLPQAMPQGGRKRTVKLPPATLCALVTTGGAPSRAWADLILVAEKGGIRHGLTA